MNTPITMDIHEVLEHLPHRYPFLLIDRVLEVVPNERIVALKNVTINEPFFPGHYPHHPVMPGVLVIEAMAQASALLTFKSMGTKPDASSVYYFVGIDNARFKRPVTAGGHVIFRMELTMNRRGMFKFKGTAEVDGQIAAEAELICAIKDK